MCEKEESDEGGWKRVQEKEQGQTRRPVSQRRREGQEMAREGEWGEWRDPPLFRGRRRGGIVLTRLMMCSAVVGTRGDSVGIL